MLNTHCHFVSEINYQVIVNDERSSLHPPARRFPQWNQSFWRNETSSRDDRIGVIFLINCIAIERKGFVRRRDGGCERGSFRWFFPIQREKNCEFATNCKYITQIGRRSQVQANVTVSAGYVIFLPPFFFPFFSLYPFFASFFTGRTIFNRRRRTRRGWSATLTIDDIVSRLLAWPSHSFTV